MDAVRRVVCGVWCIRVCGEIRNRCRYVLGVWMQMNHGVLSAKGKETDARMQRCVQCIPSWYLRTKAVNGI